MSEPLASDGERESRAEAPPELVERARHDREAFGELYDCYLPRVFAFCRLWSQTREEAEDLTAQTFERALAAIPRYQNRGAPFSLWLLRIAANAAADRSRRSKRIPTVASEPDRQVDAGQVQQWERAFWLLTHIETLPPDQQEVVRLRFYRDWSFRDIAAEMGRSEGAVKQLLRRALRALHRRLQNEGGTDV